MFTHKINKFISKLDFNVVGNNFTICGNIENDNFSLWKHGSFGDESEHVAL